MDQFNKLVLSTASNDVRFDGTEKEACVYIGKSLLGLIDLNPMSARFRFKLSKSRTRFLITYMEHLLATTSDEVRRIDDES